MDELVETVAEAAEQVREGLTGRTGKAGRENPSGEQQLEADEYADKVFLEKLGGLDFIGEYASEEREKTVDTGSGLSVAVDPLDGSSNLPTNNVVGSIIGLYTDPLPAKGETLETSIMVVYGPRTTLNVARNRRTTEYVLTDEGLKEKGRIELADPRLYGVGGNKHWHDDTREFVEGLSKDYKLRYGGSMVGDINQTLHSGGLFAYPRRKDAENGKLRVLFECNPIAHIVENAGGLAADPHQRIREKEVEKLHQRTPFFAGNREMIAKARKEL